MIGKFFPRVKRFHYILAIAMVAFFCQPAAAETAAQQEQKIGSLLMQAARDLAALASAHDDAPVEKAGRIISDVKKEVDKLKQNIEPAVYNAKYGDYKAYIDAYDRVARALLTLKNTQHAIDKLPLSCVAAEKDQNALIAQYLNTSNTDGIEALPEKYKKIGAQLGLDVKKAEAMKGELQSAFNSVGSFNPKGKEWDEVEQEMKGSAQKIFAWWTGVLKQVNDDCREIVKGEKDQDIVAAIDKLDKIEDARLSEGQKLTRDIARWKAEAVSLVRLDCTAMKEIWLNYCGSDWEPNEDEDGAQAKSFSNSKAKTLEEPAKKAYAAAKELTIRIETLKTKPETVEAAKNADLILKKYMPRLDRLSKNGALRGSAHPFGQYSVEFGKNQHKRLEGGYHCDVKDKKFTTLSGGERPDCVQFSSCTVFEFKPNSAGAIKKGGGQLAKYVPAVEKYYQDLIKGGNKPDKEHGLDTFDVFKKAKCASDTGVVKMEGAFGLYEMCKNDYVCESVD
jgi:hypothetical protein